MALTRFSRNRAVLTQEEITRTKELTDAINTWNFSMKSISARGNADQMDAFTFVSLVKACAKKKDLSTGSRLHADILRNGLLEKSPYLASTLINMYAKCGQLSKAEGVLKTVPTRDVVCWSALIAGYVQQGHGQEALNCFESMLREGVSPDAITFTCILKACSKMGDIDKGKKIHHEIVRRGLLEKDIVLGTALVDMYAKCGMLKKAQQVLEDLPFRNIVSWSVLIAGCVQHGQSHEALNYFERMQSEGLLPDVVTFVCLLKACGSIGAIDKGKQIHDEIASKGLLATDVMLGTALVDMYAKCGMLLKAKQVLEELPFRNVVSWSALISGYVQQGQGHEALNCFVEMKHNGISPDVITFISILKACGSTCAIEKGKQIHEEIFSKGLLHKDIMLDNALVDMYAKFGMLAKAQQVLEELPIRDVVSWNALMAGYVQQEQGYEAFDCFERMQRDGVSPDTVSFICILKACAIGRLMDKGKQIHEEIAHMGLLEKDIVLGNALVDMYAKCGMLERAQQVLEGLPDQTVISWSALISGYTQQERCHEALNCFDRMMSEGLSPNSVTFICILKACAKTGAIDKGIQIHDEILNRGLLDKDIALGNALVDMYAKCGSLAKARQMLDMLPVRDVISWNTLIAVYAKSDQCEEALNCYEKMQREGLIPDAVTFICILKACGNIGAIDKGKQIHESIVNTGLLENDVVLGTALVDMYAKCGMPSKARQVLGDLSVRNTVSWNALMSGYAQQGEGHETLDCFERMQDEGILADAITFIFILKACGSMGAIDKGKQIHEEIVNRNLLGKDAILGTALVDMYAKCGALDKAQKVLEELPARNMVSWSALIAGYAQQGQGDEALNCFQEMLCEGHSPNSVTLLCVLIACSRSGLLEEAQMIFGDMTERYGISPGIDHHTSMVLVFGCAGQFDRAMSVISVMPSSDHPEVWLALLGACRKWGNVKLAKLGFDQIIQLDDAASPAAYVLMANIFAAAGMQKDAENVEALRLKDLALKNEGNSIWVDESGKIHSFSLGDKSHSQIRDINAKLEVLSLNMPHYGYFPTMHWLSKSISGHGKEVGCQHNVLLAIVCALINTNQGETIHVTDNLHICNDCHIATSAISKIEKRKIMVRGLNCFHGFEDGKCTCEH